MTAPTPEFDPEAAINVGLILAPHGLRGEVKVESLTDFPERFDPGATLWLDGAPLKVERSRWQGRSLVLKLAGIDDPTAAESLRGKELQAPPLAELGEDTYYRDDLIGLQVVDLQGEPLGAIADIFPTGSNDVYVVRGPRGELLLPAIDDVIKEIDLAGRRIVVEVIEGLEWHVGRGSKQHATSNRARKPRR